MTRMMIVCASLMLVLGGCDKKEGGDSPAADKADKTAKAAPAAAASALDLSDFGLTAAAPAGATVQKMGKKVMVRGTDLVVTVGPAASFDAADVKAALSEAEGNKGENMKPETLADGFILTYENKGSAGSNYWVAARRTIDGKDYSCGTTASTPAQQSAAAAFCKSLKKK